VTFEGHFGVTDVTFCAQLKRSVSDS